MKTPSSVSVACCAALLTVPLMAQAASKNLALTDTEPQYASKLCWAAADVLAVNRFYPACPATANTSTTTPPLFPTSQALEAAYNKWIASGGVAPKWASSGAAPLTWYQSNICEPQIGNCDDWGVPPLNGLTFKWGTDFPDPMGLDWSAMTQEIDGGRPVLFMWDYPSNGTNTSSPVGLHELVVIGYSDDIGIQQLQIWDPWPVPDPPPSQVPACGPDNAVQVTQNHSRTIPFSTYRTPVNDMGVPVTAVHDRDQWNLAAVGPIPSPPTGLTVDGGPPAPPAPPPPFHKSQQPASGPKPQISFAKALGMALPESRRLNLQVSGAAPRSPGVPFPVVGLGFVQLLRAADDPTKLLAGNTSAILFPVESQGKVVDTFLLLLTRGRWEPGGYANIEITQRLVNVRAEYAARRHLPLDSFYMVSVPGEVAFFAAYGRGNKAILIPASTDSTIGALAGVAAPADRQLKELIFAIRRDLLLDSDRRRASVRLR
jgi:Peptidase_C39 like family